MINIDLNDTKGSDIITKIYNHITSDYNKTFNEIASIVSVYDQFDVKTISSVYNIGIYIDINTKNIFDTPEINKRILISQITPNVMTYFVKDSGISDDNKRKLVKSFAKSLYTNYSTYNELLIEDSNNIKMFLDNGMLTTDFFSIDELIRIKSDQRDFLDESIFNKIIDLYTDDFGYDTNLLKFIIHNYYKIDAEYILKNFSYDIITESFDQLEQEVKNNSIYPDDYYDNFCLKTIYKSSILEGDLESLSNIRKYIKPNDTYSSKDIVDVFNYKVNSLIDNIDNKTKCLNKINIKTNNVLIYRQLKELLI